jgi:hypothetical protein
LNFLEKEPSVSPVYFKKNSKNLVNIFQIKKKNRFRGINGNQEMKKKRGGWEKKFSFFIR